MTSEFRWPAVALLVAALVLPAVSSIAQTADRTTLPPYLDPSRPVGLRVDDLIGRMTLE